MTANRRVLFHRDFQGFTGGHLKIWHYFNHVLAAPGFEARAAFTENSLWDTSNPWAGSPRLRTEWDPEKADMLFLGGMDWKALPEKQRANSSRPILNLIQHPRHAEKGELRDFLRHRAIRICVSQEVADAIGATGEVNGPLFVIANGTDLSADQGTLARKRPIDLLICGMKAPELSKEVFQELKPAAPRVECITDRLPRAEYLARIAQAKVTLFLPRPKEGFYLPPLEGMAAGTVVVCPDCEGNRGFCHDGENCFRPGYGAKKIVGATLQALEQPREQRKAMKKRAAETVREHSLEREREEFLEVLAKVDTLWSSR